MTSLDAAVALGADGVGITVRGIGVFVGRGADFVGIAVGVGVAVRVSTGAVQAANVKMLIVMRMKARRLLTNLPSEYFAVGLEPFTGYPSMYQSLRGVINLTSIATQASNSPSSSSFT